MIMMRYINIQETPKSRRNIPSSILTHSNMSTESHGLILKPTQSAGKTTFNRGQHSEMAI